MMRPPTAMPLLAAALLLIFSCQGPDSGGAVAARVLEKALAGDEEFLKKTSVTPALADELILRRPGSAFYLALRYTDWSIPENAETLLIRTFVKDRDPWRKEAGRELMRRSDRRENGEARPGDASFGTPISGDARIGDARRFRELYPDDPEGRVFLLQALLRAGLHQDMIEEVRRFPGEPGEEEIFLAAGAYRKLGRPEWVHEIRTLFLHRPAHPVHIRSAGDGDFPEAAFAATFPKEEIAFFRAKAFFAAGSYAAALPGYRNAPASFRRGAVFLREYGEIHLKTARHRDGIRDLERMLPGLEGEALLAAREQLGKLYRQAGKYEAAVSVLKKAREQWEKETGPGIRPGGEAGPDTMGAAPGGRGIPARLPEDGDRLLWYILSSSLRRSPEAFLTEYSLLRRKIHDPRYFSDLFEPLAAELLRRGRWNGLREAFESTKDSPGVDHARFAFLLAEGIRRRLYRNLRGLPPVRDLLETAHARGNSFHSLLAGIALGKPFSPAGPGAEPDDSPGENPGSDIAEVPGKAPGPVGGLGRRPGETPVGSPLGGLGGSPVDGPVGGPVGSPVGGPVGGLVGDPGVDPYLRGFADFGLSRRGILAARSLPEPPDLDTAALLTEMEAAQGRHIEGLRLLARAARRSPEPLNRRVLEILYPRAFREETDGAIREFSLSPAVYYSLVREESHFEPAIRSSAGAVGLAQLMPATARDMARKLKVDQPDLTDPRTNLQLGARHLADLKRRFGPGVHYLAAYNAGGGRVNQWKRQFRGLSQVLFAEALPFAETREYIRKVLVAAVHYGYLYDGKTPAETVSELLSDFVPLPGRQEKP